MNVFLAFLMIISLPAVYGNSIQPAGNTNEGDIILGTWELPNGIWVKIYKEGATYNGVIASVEHYIEGETLDVKNPARQNRSQPLLGKQIITGLHYDPKTREWIGGDLYAPEKGMTVNLLIKSADAKQAEAVGSRLLFSRTLLWKRILQ